MKIISDSRIETFKIGRVIAGRLQGADIVCLSGELGSGKTVLAKGIAAGLGISGDKVISPSFVLIREYKGGRLPLYHFDLYRLEALKDIIALGFEEYFYGDGVTVIEWAQRLKSMMPEEYLKVELRIKSNSKRLLEISAYGRHYEELLDKFYESRTF